MARPSPKVYNENVDKKYIKTSIVEGKAVYFVTYQGNVINVLKTHTLKDENSNGNKLGAKYMRTTFVNPAHAINQAEKLNKLFNTTDFKVARTTQFMYV